MEPEKRLTPPATPPTNLEKEEAKAFREK